MKKGGFLILGLIALLLVGGFALVSCRAGCEGDGMCALKDNKGAYCTNSKCAAIIEAIKNNDGKCDC